MRKSKFIWHVVLIQDDVVSLCQMLGGELGICRRWQAAKLSYGVFRTSRRVIGWRDEVTLPNSDWKVFRVDGNNLVRIKQDVGNVDGIHHKVTSDRVANIMRRAGRCCFLLEAFTWYKDVVLNELTETRLVEVGWDSWNEVLILPLEVMLNPSFTLLGHVP